MFSSAETAKLAAKNAESIDRLEILVEENAKAVAKNADSIDRLETTTAETAKLVAKNAEGIAANVDSIDRLETTTAETAKLVAKNAESIAANSEGIAANVESIDRLEILVEENTKSIKELDTSTRRLTETARISSGHIGDMRGLFVSQKVVREAAIIADRMGLITVQTLEPQDIIDIWNIGKAKGLTEGISKDDEDSFKIADLIIEAKTDDGARCLIAVEISYTADERDTTRAIRNAEYITKFTGTSAYAAVAGISKDDRIDEVLGDVPQPYDSEQETRVFWSKHEDIAKPN